MRDGFGNATSFDPQVGTIVFRFACVPPSSSVSMRPTAPVAPSRSNAAASSGSICTKMQHSPDDRDSGCGRITSNSVGSGSANDDELIRGAFVVFFFRGDGTAGGLES